MTPPVPRALCVFDRALCGTGAILRATAPVVVAVVDRLAVAVWYAFLVVLPALCAWCCLGTLAAFVPGIPVPFVEPADVARNGLAVLPFTLIGAAVCGFFAVVMADAEIEDRYPGWRARCQAARAARRSP